MDVDAADVAPLQVGGQQLAGPGEGLVGQLPVRRQRQLVVGVARRPEQRAVGDEGAQRLVGALAEEVGVDQMPSEIIAE